MSTERWCDDTDRRKAEVLGEKPVPVPLRPPQIPYRLDRDNPNPAPRQVRCWKVSDGVLCLNTQAHLAHTYGPKTSVQPTDSFFKNNIRLTKPTRISETRRLHNDFAADSHLPGYDAVLGASRRFEGTLVPPFSVTMIARNVGNY